MKKWIGVVLLVFVNGLSIFLNIYNAIFTYGINVAGSYCVNNANDLFASILKWFSIFCGITAIFNYFILNYLNPKIKPLFLALLLSSFCFIISVPFLYVERQNFLDSRRIRSININVNQVKVIFLKNVVNGSVLVLDKNNQELIWKIESLINFDDMSVKNKLYEIHVKLNKGELIFETNEIPKI